MRIAFAFLLMVNVAQADDLPVLNVKAEKVTIPDTVNEAIRKELNAEAWVISDATATKMKLWQRKDIPTKATPDQVKNGLTLREVPEGSLLGVIKFESPFTDYRKQEVKAGVYTLRLGFQPETGDHMGTAPHAEFLLLSALTEDNDKEPLELKTVVATSKKITGGDHPAVMLLYPHSAKTNLGKLVSKGDGVWVLNLTTTVKVDDMASTIGVALVVQGHSKTR